MCAKGVLLEARGILYYPVIGGCFGVCEALLIQQIHFRCKANGHTKEGQLWMWNSIREWSIELHMGRSTIQRAIYHLEAVGILIVGNFNKHKYDSTKWYRVEYVKLGELLKEHYHGEHEIVVDTLFKMNEPLVQKEQVHSLKTSKPIPEMSSEINSKINNPTDKPKTTGIKIMLVKNKKGPTTSNEVPIKLLAQHREKQAKLYGESVPYKNSADTLEQIWKDVVPKLQDFSGCIPKFTMAELGKLSKLCKAWGNDSQYVLPYILNNWVSFAKFVEDQVGLKKSPNAPQIDFLLKYAPEAVAYRTNNDVQLIAQKPKAKIVFQKAQSKQVVEVKVEESQEAQASVDDVLASMALFKKK